MELNKYMYTHAYTQMKHGPDRVHLLREVSTADSCHISGHSEAEAPRTRLCVRVHTWKPQSGPVEGEKINYPMEKFQIYRNTCTCTLCSIQLGKQIPIIIREESKD